MNDYDIIYSSNINYILNMKKYKLSKSNKTNAILKLNGFYIKLLFLT